MTAATLALALAALGAGALTIVFDAAGKRRLVYIFKPLALLLLIALAALAPALRGSLAPPSYRTFILLGLGLSLIGDAFMMLRRKRFEAGLAAFLGAHIFYILAFRSDMLPRFAVQPLFPLVLVAALILRTLLPRLGKLKYPVLLYILVITVMAGLAAGRYIQWGGPQTLAAFAGALLFMASDAVLAFDRFVRPVRRAQALILGTYFAAQTLIALSA